MNAATIEKNFKEYLLQLASLTISANEIKNDHAMYNDCAVKSYEYFSKVVLLSKQNRSLINNTGYEFDMFTNDILLHFLNNLDYVLSCSSEQIIPFIVTMANHKVIDIVRKWNKIYFTPNNAKRKYRNSNATKNNCIQPALNNTVIFLDDASWNLLSSDTDIEGEYLRKEENAELHKLCLIALNNISVCSKFEAVSLLATKVLTTNGKCIKTKFLAEAINHAGLDAISKACFETAANVFNISYDKYFTLFTNNSTPQYNDIEDLCVKISHASNNCAVKLAKKMGIKRLAKKYNKQNIEKSSSVL